MYIYLPHTTAHEHPEIEEPHSSIEAMAACWESLEKAVLRLGDEKKNEKKKRKPTSLEGRLGVVR